MTVTNKCEVQIYLGIQRYFMPVFLCCVVFASESASSFLLLQLTDVVVVLLDTVIAHTCTHVLYVKHK